MHISSIYLAHINQETHYNSVIYREKPLHFPGVEPRTTDLPGQTLDHYAAGTGEGNRQIKYT